MVLTGKPGLRRLIYTSKGFAPLPSGSLILILFTTFSQVGMSEPFLITTL